MTYTTETQPGTYMTHILLETTDINALKNNYKPIRDKEAQKSE